MPRFARMLFVSLSCMICAGFAPINDLTTLPSSGAAFAQEAATETAGETTQEKPADTTSAESTSKPPGDGTDSIIKQGEAKIEEIGRTLDASPEAQKLSAGILDPIYKLAELIGHPWLYWVAFALMTTGVVSFALQLVIGKLVVLMKLHISFTEILSDALGLAISLVGLVFTTQAATENSTFPQSAASVLSATAVGVVLGYFFYVWGQRQELRAVHAAKQGK
ncbi:hypothetical protein Plim_1540 [Planctopirus limnophila DSM 3776]|uniref:Uncharacterized protein n=1 Tax=Planctopirus limnophila (strain ATCC 43296 / DSM 3776 / IFAM 1008 / Mu 290) TaxID=521674 RepID=D5SW88_PLAL2|nr:hypothetical protein [Planctopirus limnophila]ADG67373.1 hypothetical protein Plim_1540 [Planctopirus limnophila DSM 3776]